MLLPSWKCWRTQGLNTVYFPMQVQLESVNFEILRFLNDGTKSSFGSPGKKNIKKLEQHAQVRLSLLDQHGAQLWSKCHTWQIA